jgi:hypothetical protein
MLVLKVWDLGCHQNQLVFWILIQRGVASEKENLINWLRDLHLAQNLSELL